MMDLIGGALAHVQVASQIVQGMLSLKTDAAVSAKALELNRVLIELTEQIFACQAQIAALISRESELKAEVANLKDWSHDKERYELCEIVPGTLAYRVQPGMQGAEPMHYLCPRCYQQHIKSILQDGGIKDHRHYLQCPECQTVFPGARISERAEVMTVARHRSMI